MPKAPERFIVGRVAARCDVEAVNPRSSSDARERKASKVMPRMKRKHGRLLSAAIGVAVVGTFVAAALGSVGSGLVSTLLVAKADNNEIVHLNKRPDQIPDEGSDRRSYPNDHLRSRRPQRLASRPVLRARDGGVGRGDRIRFAVQLDDVRTELSERSPRVEFDPFDQVGLAELREPDGSGDLLAEPSAADWEAEAYPGSAFAALNVYSAA